MTRSMHEGTKKAVRSLVAGTARSRSDLEREAMSEVYPETAEKAPLTLEERAAIRAQLMSHDAGNALQFQAKAIRKYGAAGGIMCRELLFWDGLGWDPDGYIYLTKEEGEQRTGLSAKSQDGGRKRLEDAGVLEVERRPRRNPEGRVTHPSPVLHYRLNLRELFEQMTPEGATLNQRSKHADTDAGARRSGPSRKRKGASERAVTGAPFTEGTAEATAEGSSDLPPQPPQGGSNGGNRKGKQPDIREALAQLREKIPYSYDCCMEDGDHGKLVRELQNWGIGTYSEAAVGLAARVPTGQEEVAS